MKTLGGYAGKIAEIDLNKQEIVVRKVDPKWAVEYIGARGWSARMIWENLSANPTLDPLGPDNVAIISAGPLSGLLVPSSGKTTIAAISPATGGYGDTNMGGKFAAELKFSGLDALVFKGISRKPVYVFIDDDVVELRNAKDYWGKGSLETEESLKKDLGEEFQVATIGSAAEKLVNFACITTHFGRNGGRAGLGTVLGSKKVKAVAVKGTKNIPVADLDKLFELSREAWKWIIDNPGREIYHRHGTLIMIDIASETGILPTNNFADGFFKKFRNIDGDAFEKDYRVISRSCSFCPMFCGQWSFIKEGPYKGRGIEGPEYETAGMLGSNVGISNLNTIIAANYLCDELGMDTVSAGNLAALAMDMLSNGILTKQDLNGLDLKFGEDNALLEFIRMMGEREGIGDIFAGGTKAVLEKWPGARRYAVHGRGLEQSAYDTRSAPDMALAYATCDVGAHHNRAWTIFRAAQFGPNATKEDVANLVIYHQHIRPVFDSLGVCRFPWIELGYPEDNYAKFYSAATGVETTLQELLARTEVSYNLTRAINVIRGVTRKDEYPPERAVLDPVISGPHKGKTINLENYEKLLDTYFEMRGWDKKTGIPTRRKLEELGMADVAARLQDLGKI